MTVIDSKKLLPQSKSSGESSESPILVPIKSILFKKDVNISSKFLKPSEDNRGSAVSPKNILVIKKKVLKLKDFIGSTYLIQRSENKRRGKQRERSKVEEREKKIEEKPNTNLTGNDLPKFSLPGASILDTINRFIGFTLLGYIFDKYNEYLPKLLEFSKNISPLIKFVEIFSKNVLESLYTFIDSGYKAYDFVSKSVENIGGKGAKKEFEEFSKNLNLVLNGAIIAAMAVAGTSKSPKGIAGSIGSNAAAAATGGYGYKKQPLPSGVKSATIEGRAITSQQRIAERAAAKESRRISGANLRRGIGGGAEEAAVSGGVKSATKLGIARVPIIGALIGFIVDTLIFHENPSRAAAGAAGNAVGSGIGLALAGAGTFGIGAGVGLLVGGFLGDMVGKSLYDAFTGYKEEPIQAKAQGGTVTSGKQSNITSIRRIKTTRKPTIKRVSSQQTQPGKDIGGKLKIEQLYGKDEPGKRSALRALKKSSEDFKKMRSLNGIVGFMFGAGIDMALGQKPDNRLAASLGSMFGSVIQTAIDGEMNSSFNDISRTLTMANGGVVPSRNIGIDSGMSIGEKIGRYISNALAISIGISATKILQNLNREFNLAGQDTVPGATFGSTPDGVTGVDVKGESVGFVGSTGHSTGTHIHFENITGAKTDLPKNVRDNIIVAGKPMSSWTITSGPGPRWGKYHAGEDWAAMPHGAPIKLSGGLKFVKFVKEGSDPRYDGYGNVTIIQDQRGTLYLLGHLSGGPSDPQKIIELQTQQTKVIPSNLQGTGKTISGKASFYGGPNDKYWEGRQTASGEIFDSRKLTAAMMSPGFDGRKPFMAKVTNTANGKSVVVKVNDTGGFNPLGRIIDLSHGAFSKISEVSAGVINVTVEKLASAPKQIPPQQNQQPPKPTPNQSLGKVSGYGKINGYEYFYAGGKYWERKDGVIKQIDARQYAAVRYNSPSDFGIPATVDVNKLKLPDGGYRLKSDYEKSLIGPSQSNEIASLRQHPSYSQSGMVILQSNTIAIQPVEVPA